jgi:hypothetical protein
MVVIVALVLLEAAGIWGLRRWQDAHSVMPAVQRCGSTGEASMPMSQAALTEDDVIRFGRAIEASNDVISDLLADCG